MRVWPVVAAAALIAPVVGNAAKAPNAYLVTVSGTVTIDSTVVDHATYEGTSCKVDVVYTGHDTIEYATVKPMRLTVAGGKAATHATVPYKHHQMSGTQSEGTPTGTLPNGSPCPPLTLLTPACRTYTGDLVLHVELDGNKVTVSSPARPFQPLGPCPGATYDNEVPASTGALPANQAVALVHGSGEQSWTHVGVGTMHESSRFSARFVRQ
jgi:hypothetical protein